MVDGGGMAARLNLLADTTRGAYAQLLEPAFNVYGAIALIVWFCLARAFLRRSLAWASFVGATAVFGVWRVAAGHLNTGITIEVMLVIVLQIVLCDDGIEWGGKFFKAVTTEKFRFWCIREGWGKPETRLKSGSASEVP